VLLTKNTQKRIQNVGWILAAITLVAIFLFSTSPEAKAESYPLDWSNIPRKEQIVTGVGGAYSRFRTTTSKTYRGYISAAADSSSGHLTRRLWFSVTPLGEPITTMYLYKGELRNCCDVSGVEPALRWSQEKRPAFLNTCKLKRDKQYYLNYSQAAFGTGAGPTPLSRLIRGASTGGRP